MCKILSVNSTYTIYSNYEGHPIIKQLWRKIFQKRAANKQHPQQLATADHYINPKAISSNAIKVLRQLRDRGFNAYLVGGSVRDLLLGKIPKDFDIATNAHPEQVKKLFRNCILIGRRFRLAHVMFGPEIIEVATFRGGDIPKARQQRHTAEHGMILRDNVFGNLEEDVWRRDFTVNALYYDVVENTIIDYCSGLADLKQKKLRIIGNPEKRFQEDPVRLLRTIRFAAKLDFTIESNTAEPIRRLAPLLNHVPAARLFDEAIKLFHSGHAAVTFDLLINYDLLAPLFPQLARYLAINPEKINLLKQVCENTDARIHAEKSVSPAYLFASLLWPVLQIKASQLIEQFNYSTAVAYARASHDVIREQLKSTSIQKRFTGTMREIWQLQFHLENRRKKSAFFLLHHPRLRAAYDFLLWRAQINEVPQSLADWWTHFISADNTEREILLKTLPKSSKQRKSKKRRKKT